MTRTNNFDGIRIIAASMVIIGHAYAITGTQGGMVIWQSGIHSLGLKFFFTISGYLIVKSFIFDSHFPRFLLKRALRIFPALIVFVILSAFVLGPFVTTLPLNDYFFQPGFSKYFQNMILILRPNLPGVFADNPFPRSVNGVLWSLLLEFIMYLLVMLVGFLSLAFAPYRRVAFDILWAILTLSFIITSNFTASGAWDLSYIHSFIATPSIFALFSCMSYFGIGGMIFIAERYSLKTKTTIALIAVAILLQIDSSHLLAVTNFILIAFIVISVGQASWPVLRDLGRWGDLSYGTYVYGWSVAQVLALYFLDDFGVGWHIILALLISYVFGFFSWHLVEKYALRLKPKRAVEPCPTRLTTPVVS